MDTHEASIYTAVVITALVLGSTIIFFAFSIFRQQRRYIKMQRMYFSVELELLEKERYRVARDLHDELGPSLSLSRSHISEIQAVDPQSLMHIEKASGFLFDVMQKMGQIAHNLAPVSLEKKGLKFALMEFLEGLQEVSNIRFELIYYIKEEMELNRRIHLYRIVQELGHNAVKHSGASKMDIHLKEKNDKIYLYSKDNGSGFEMNRAFLSNGLGLGSIKSRTELLKGKMRWQSKSQNGTMYFFEFPKEMN